MMLLPLHTLLGVKLENFCLVADNARSPTDPISFRGNQRSHSGGSSNPPKSRWSSMPPCVDDNKEITNLQDDTNCSSSMVGMLSSPLRGKSGETSGSGVPPIRVLVRQLSSILKQAGKRSPTRSPTTTRKDNIKLMISAPLQVPVRKRSPVVTQRKHNNYVKSSISAPPLGALSKGSPFHIKSESSDNGVTPVRVLIRQLSQRRIQKEGKGSPSSPATKKIETTKRSISCYLRIPVRQMSRKQISVQDETANTTTSQRTTKSDIKSTTSTGSRPRLMPILRRSLRSIHKGSSEGGHIVISRDLVKPEKLTTALLRDSALKETEAVA
jgi:hypothetical protein